MAIATVSWVAGDWLLENDGVSHRVIDQRWLESWLSARDATRSDLEFASASLKQRFIHDFGPLNRRRTAR